MRNAVDRDRAAAGAVVRARCDGRQPRAGSRDGARAPGPELPADAATNTPDAAALKNATMTGSRKFVCVAPIEWFRTSTPSATLWSIAATRSADVQLAVLWSGSSQHTL